MNIYYNATDKNPIGTIGYGEEMIVKSFTPWPPLCGKIPIIYKGQEFYMDEVILLIQGWYTG